MFENLKNVEGGNFVLSDVGSINAMQTICSDYAFLCMEYFVFFRKLLSSNSSKGTKLNNPFQGFSDEFMKSSIVFVFRSCVKIVIDINKILSLLFLHQKFVLFD